MGGRKAAGRKKEKNFIVVPPLLLSHVPAMMIITNTAMAAMMVIVQKGGENELKTAPRIACVREKPPIQRKERCRRRSKQKEVYRCCCCGSGGTFPSLIARREMAAKTANWTVVHSELFCSAESVTECFYGEREERRIRSHKKHRLESFLFSLEWLSLYVSQSVRASDLQLIPLPLPPQLFRRRRQP